jgi:hypothetical protein
VTFGLGPMRPSRRGVRAVSWSRSSCRQCMRNRCTWNCFIGNDNAVLKGCGGTQCLDPAR